MARRTKRPEAKDGQPAKSTREQAAQRLADRARREVEELSVMSRMERSAEESARKLGQEEMDRQIATLAAEDGTPKPCPKCGKPVPTRAKAVARTFHSLWGTHTVVRNYHYCGECKRGFAPRDLELGLPETGELTGELEGRVMDFALNDSFGRCEQRWALHYPHRLLSENQFRQSTQRLGTMLENANPVLLQEAAKPQEPEAASTLYVMNDGSHIPCRGEWKEAKLGLFFRGEEYVSGHEANRGRLLEPRYVACVGPQEEFLPLMQAAWQVEAACRPARTAWLGDGAPGNWTLANTVCPSAIQILDWPHALEHAVDVGKTILGESDPLLPSWQTRMEQLLWEGDGEAMVREVMSCLEEGPSAAGLKAINDFIGYARENAPRMKYREFSEAGLLIGSGPVESAHRHVFQERMKKAGQHWSIPGADRMARLRAHYRTAGPQRFYAAARWAHRESEKLPVRTASKKRRASNR